MRKSVVVLWMCLVQVCAGAQVQVPDTGVTVYETLESALANPAEVYVLDLTKTRLEEFPADIFKFTNLRCLYLGKNKIKSIPPQIGTLTQLEVFDISKNRIEEVPVELFNCVKLKKLILNQNLIESLPRQINRLQELTYLDMWSNNIGAFPDEIKECKKIKEIDLRVIEMTKDEQERIRKQLPQAEIHFSPFCSCSR